MSRLTPDSGFIEFLEEVGADFSLVQGIGGNASVKSHETMLVKSSGKRLGEASAPNYFYEVGISHGEYFEPDFAQPGRPSIEVFLHAMLPYRYVLHLHSTKGVALSLLAADNNVLRDEVHRQGISIIPYHTPGISLKDAIKSKVRYSESKIEGETILLNNHGTLFGANSISQLRDNVLNFEALAASNLNWVRPELTPEDLTVLIDKHDLELIQWHSRENWRISPDHVVFLGVDAPSTMHTGVRANSTVLKFLESVFPGHKKISPREEQMLWYLNVVNYLPKTKFPTLDRSEAHRLLSWDREKDRLEAASE